MSTREDREWDARQDRIADDQAERDERLVTDGRITVLVVPDDESLPIKTVDIDGSLESFQVLVGGYIEGIGGQGWSAYVDEEGRIKNRPVNHRASIMAKRMGWREEYLCGTTVFIGEVDDEGNDTDVPPFVIKQALLVTPGNARK